LVAEKLHSGRLTDARDVITLIEDTDLDDVANHIERGDTAKLRKILEDVEKTVSDCDFADSFKGVFSTRTRPEDQIQRLQQFIQRITRNITKRSERIIGGVSDDDQIDSGPDWRDFGTDPGTRERAAPVTPTTRQDKGLGTKISHNRDGTGRQLSGKKRRQLSRLRTRHLRARVGSKQDRHQINGHPNRSRSASRRRHSQTRSE
jgi:hypothetical protein